MRLALYGVAVAVLACANGHDPAPLPSSAVLLSNGQAAGSIVSMWRTPAGLIGSDTVAPLTTACERFTVRADSARFEVLFGADTARSAWFDPTAKPLWATVQVANGTVYSIPETSPPC